MFTRKTLFVLGAGSSKEAGLPIGDELKALLIPKLNIKFNRYEQLTGNKQITQALRAHVGNNNDMNPLRICAVAISEGLRHALSIDDYHESHRSNEDFQLCGKIGIAQCILEAENSSIFFIDPRSNHRDASEFHKIEATWYQRFFTHAAQGLYVEDLDRIFDNVSVISFNYDRSLEHFIVHAIRSRFNVSVDRAQEVARRLNVFHPYGTVGPLPWQGSDHGIAYGDNPDYAPTLLDCASRIRTYSEQVSHPKVLEGARRGVSEAHAIVFLGFAFHVQNLKLIAPEPIEKRGKRIFATAYRESPADCLVFRRRIRSLLDEDLKDWVFDRDSDCNMLLHHYGRSLMIDT